jgi:hypothetical protein
VVTPPHRVTQEKVNRVKTDRIDARRLAKNRIRKMLDFHGLNEGLLAGRWTEGDYKRLKTWLLSPSLQVSADHQARVEPGAGLVDSVCLAGAPS